jgi:hypothetical protein
MQNATFGLRAEPEIRFRYATAERMRNPLAGRSIAKSAVASAKRHFRTEGEGETHSWVEIGRGEGDNGV